MVRSLRLPGRGSILMSTAVAQKKRGGCVRENARPTKGTTSFARPEAQNNVNLSQVDGGYALPASPWRGEGPLPRRRMSLDLRFILGAPRATYPHTSHWRL